MAGNKEALRAQYQRLSDEDIERLANYEADQLIPEALAILKEEIKKRGLSDEFQIAADIQAKGIPEHEQEEIIRKISMFPCPLCGKKQNYLNGFNVMMVRSYIIFTMAEKRLIIACSECISNSAKSALIKNLFLGWWGIPWGPIRTIRSILLNLKAINAENYNAPAREFIEFIKPHSAAIKARIESIRNVSELLDLITEVLHFHGDSFSR
jgi:hypothetical protein